MENMKYVVEKVIPDTRAVQKIVELKNYVLLCNECSNNSPCHDPCNSGKNHKENFNVRRCEKFRRFKYYVKPHYVDECSKCHHSYLSHVNTNEIKTIVMENYDRTDYEIKYKQIVKEDNVKLMIAMKKEIQENLDKLRKIIMKE